MRISTEIEPGFSALMIATILGDLRLCDLLLQFGANIDQQNSQGQTALYFATFYEYPKIVNRLLEQKADPNIANDLGRTPLFYAKTSDIAQALLDHGANLQHRDQQGRLVIHDVSVSMLDFFHKVDGDFVKKAVTTRDADGCTPLHGDLSSKLRSNFGQELLVGRGRQFAFRTPLSFINRNLCSSN